MTLDATDWKILRELQRHGRLTNVELASRVGLSPPPCLRRVQALEKIQAGEMWIERSATSRIFLELSRHQDGRWRSSRRASVSALTPKERQTVEALSAVNERLSLLARQISQIGRTGGPERPEDVPGFPALESAIRSALS